MRLHIISDLHLEFAPFLNDAVAADVVILAGDIHIGTKGIRPVGEMFPQSEVIYVLGNHEFYGQKIPGLVDKAKALTKGTRTHVLENDRLDLGGVTFLGATLWTDFAMTGNAVIAELVAAQRMTDFHRIRLSRFYRKFRPADARRMHLQSLRWLESETRETNGRKTVVVTHHAPTPQSIARSYVDDALNPAYASDLEAFMLDRDIHLWVHGHIHSGSDYTVGNTRVIANPRGYPGENSANFNPSLVVEI